MGKKGADVPRRIMLMLGGVFFIGTSVACYRLSGFGVDPFSCMNLGISGFIGMTFGNWQVVANAVLLAAAWFTVRRCIGLGTIVGMVFVGYIADFLCWMFMDGIGLSVTWMLRLVFLLLGALLLSLGCACCMAADMGIAPYDSVAFILVKCTGEKLPFRFARMLSDLCAILIGVLFRILARGSIWEILGLGTVVNACFGGPHIHFFHNKIKGKRNLR